MADPCRGRAYRLVAAYGWADLVFTHISAKLPGVDEQFLINPYERTFRGNHCIQSGESGCGRPHPRRQPVPVNPARIHHPQRRTRGPLRRQLRAAHASIGIGVSAQRCGVSISQQSIFVLSSLGYHDYEGVALRDDEKPRLVADLGSRTFLMLRNHGLLTVGASVADAFLAMYLFETACAIQLRAQWGAANWCRCTRRFSPPHKRSQQVTRNLGGALAWPALLFKLDRMDSSYRD